MAICGPSQAEQQIEGQQQNLAETLAADSSARFAQQTQVLNNINQTLSPIIAAGPSQTGFSAEELAALNTNAINSAGAAAKNAQQSVGNSLAGQGGGAGSPLQSGIQSQIKGAIASTEAGNLANTQNQIVQANYATGRENFNNAVNGSLALSGQLSPDTFANSATSGFNSAFGEANTINQQQQAATKDILSGVTSLASGALTFGMGGLGNLDTMGSSTGGEQAKNFFSGGFNALAGE